MRQHPQVEPSIVTLAVHVRRGLISSLLLYILKMDAVVLIVDPCASSKSVTRMLLRARGLLNHVDSNWTSSLTYLELTYIAKATS